MQTTNRSQQPTPLQKYVMHPTTAFLFAFAVAKFVRYFQLIDYQYAWQLCFVITFISYMLLSIKYEMILSAIFFSAALVLFYKSLQIKPLETNPATTEQTIQNRLSTIVSLVHQFYLNHQKYPAHLAELEEQYGSLKQHKINYCSQETCKKIDNLAKISDTHFLIWETVQNKIIVVNHNFDLLILTSPNVSSFGDQIFTTKLRKKNETHF